MPVLTRLHIIFWSYIEDRKTLDFWGDKPFGLFPVTLPIWKRWQCHVEWEKRTRDAAVQAQMSCDRTSKAPCQSSALLGIMQVLLDHMPPSRKGGVLLVGGFVNSSILWMYRIGGKTFDITFKSVLRLISGQVCKICDCWWKIFWPVEMMFTERSCIVVYLYRRTLQT